MAARLNLCYIGVRSGMASDGESHETQAITREVPMQTVRMSRRPPPRFTEKTDLPLWLTRFELYVRQATIPEEQWTGELLPLLEDVPFRIVSQPGLATSTDYQAVVRCLNIQFSPDGNELEWQFRLQQRTQKPEESLIEFSGALGQLADKAYPKWSGEQRQEMLRNHFIQGVRSFSIQLKLMREMPATLADAVRLASQQETVEAAQKRLHRERSVHESMAVHAGHLEGEDESILSPPPGASTHQTLNVCRGNFASLMLRCGN